MIPAIATLWAGWKNDDREVILRTMKVAPRMIILMVVGSFLLGILDITLRAIQLFG